MHHNYQANESITDKKSLAEKSLSQAFFARDAGVMHKNKRFRT